jgi:hypothetical protein
MDTARRNALVAQILEANVATVQTWLEQGGYTDTRLEAIRVSEIQFALDFRVTAVFSTVWMDEDEGRLAESTLYLDFYADLEKGIGIDFPGSINGYIDEVPAGYVR